MLNILKIGSGIPRYFVLDHYYSLSATMISKKLDTLRVIPWYFQKLLIPFHLISNGLTNGRWNSTLNPTNKPANKKRARQIMIKPVLTYCKFRSNNYFTKTTVAYVSDYISTKHRNSNQILQIRAIKFYVIYRLSH